MAFKSIVREFKEMKQGIGKKGANMRHMRKRGVAPERCQAPLPMVQQTQWADLPTELLLDIIQRLEASETSWPARRDVVACAAVCRSWREITKEVVQTPEKCGLLTFPISLKQPGTREHPIQCFIKRERETSTYRLYLGLNPAVSGDVSKMLLAARKTRRATSTGYAISLTGDDFSRSSDAYVGKLRSNFLGTKFTVYDSQPTQGPSTKSTRHSHKRVQSCHACASGYASHYYSATVAYELNVLRTRGPRRIRCIMHSIPLSSIQEGGTAPTPTEFRKSPEEEFYPSSAPKGKKPSVDFKSESAQSPKEPPLVLKNKAPRWHEQLQCWCLNFKGRVTVASVKNFQLAAAVDSSGQDVSEEERDKVILQFGKIGKDIFTMDYRYPLSAFQAFAICLSSFDTKPACE